MRFQESQISFMKEIGISADFSKSLSDSDYQEIEEKLSEYLQIKGFDKEYLPTAEGKLCESILDLL